MNQKYKIIGLLFIFLLLQFSANAQFIVTESKIRRSVSPGQTITDVMSVHNTSTAKIKLIVYFEDFKYVSPFDGTKEFLPAESTMYSCVPWISFSPQEFVLPPNGKQEIHYTINVPPDAQGGRYGVLFFESVPETNDSRVGLSIVTRIGCLFFLESTKKNKHGELKDFSATGNVISTIFMNNGDTILLPSLTYYLMDDQSMVADRGAVDRFYLPPGEQYTCKIPIDPNLKSGQYLGVLTVDLEDGDALVQELDITKDMTGVIKVIQSRP